MRKILVLVTLFMGLSAVSFSQSAGGSGAEKVNNGKARRSGKSGQIKPRKQMRHFESRKADPNIKNNGTSYSRQRRREQYESENSGFNESKKRK